MEASGSSPAGSYWAVNPIRMPPGESSTVWQWRAPLREWDSRISAWPQVELLGMLPHMHALGRRMQVTIKRSGDDAESCGLYVDRWDFNWQRSYSFQEPVLLFGGESLRATAHWDNTALNPHNPNPDAAVYWGEKTSDEMMALSITYEILNDGGN